MASNSTAKTNEQNVKRYYDYTRLFYKYFWHGETNSLHYGFYDDSVNDHKEALLKTVEVTVQHAGIDSSDKVVDFGCGVGGTVFWIAKNVGAHTSGITISESQYKKALRLRKEFDLEDRTSFNLGDFFSTPFADNQFDAVVSIEASCHGQHAVHELASEMYRVLKPGGRIAIMDGYLGREQLSPLERKQVEKFEEGLALVKMITPNEFIKALKAVGFKDSNFKDYTENVLPTSKLMFELTTRWYFLTKLLTNLRLVPLLMLKNNIAGQVQYELTKNRALVYGCITAKK